MDMNQQQQTSNIQYLADFGEQEQLTSAVDIIDEVLSDAINKNASDIHFEPYQHCYRIRFRIDGVLITALNITPLINQNMAARVKVLANMDIAEKRFPQDGRFMFSVDNNVAVEFRVSTLPTLWGEKVVLRLIDNTSKELAIDELGFDNHQTEIFKQALTKPQGLILVTGPTGSGKSFTLYSGLSSLNDDNRNI